MCYRGTRVATILKRESETQQVEQLCDVPRVLDLLDVRLHGARGRDLNGHSETYWTLSPAAAQQKKWASFFVKNLRLGRVFELFAR
jgi:hypothetical protein